MAAQRIDHHGALTDQQLTGPVQHQNRLLLGAFRQRKAHRRTRHRLTDRFCIRGVVLVRFDEGTNVLRGDQPYFVPECLQLPSPIVRRGAGFSSQNQREASIEDQVRLCREFVESQGWTYLHAYTDRAVSGSSPIRAGYQKLLEDARADEFDVVVSEALDRLSRDLEDVAGPRHRPAASPIESN